MPSSTRAAPRAASVWQSEKRISLKARRLRAQPQFEALRSSPSLARTEHFVLHGLVLQPLSGRLATQVPALFPATGPWLGAVTPKRWAKRAVTRNLIRRQIYSVAEQHLLTMGVSASDRVYLVRLRAAYASEQFRSAASSMLRQTVHTELERLFARAVNSTKGGLL